MKDSEKIELVKQVAVGDKITVAELKRVLVHDRLVRRAIFVLRNKLNIQLTANRDGTRNVVSYSASGNIVELIESAMSPSIITKKEEVKNNE